MAPSVRPLADRDHDGVVALSLRAWAPVFASMERVLGPSGVFAALYPGFVAATLADEHTGEVHMLAVDPPFQRRGIGTALLEVATAWIAGQGRAVALVGTGGDPGHAPARRVYERAGFTGLPAVHYFRTL